MPDITMCLLEECPKKLICYRYVAISDKYQCYFSEDPRKKDGSCEYFWDIELPKNVYKKRTKRT